MTEAKICDRCETVYPFKDVTKPLMIFDGIRFYDLCPKCDEQLSFWNSQEYE